MKPFFITVDTTLPLMIVPNSQAHMDGHPVLTLTYSIFKKSKDDAGFVDTDAMEGDKTANPDYVGTIIFEEPGKLFNYVPDGLTRLTGAEVQEAIELITEYRENSQSWSL